MAYKLGVTRILSVEFKDANGSFYDPPRVRYIRRVNSGTATTYVYPTDAQLVKDSTGNYHVNEVIPLANTSAGTWSIRWEALETDLTTSQVADEYDFEVERSSFYS